MTTTINASTSSGLVQTADTSGTLALQTANNTALTIDASQNVGIGTASPSNLLHVSQASSDFQARITGTSAANAGSIRTYNAGGEATGLGTTGASNAGYGANLGFMGTITNIPQIFLTNNAERMRIDSSGNVGIGTSSPIQKLHIGGNGNMYATSGATWYTGGDLYIRAGTGGILRLGANNANDLLTLNTSGNLVLNGGNTTANGVGVTFPATQSASSDANTLDDYEEGTWTPVIVPQTGSLTSYTSSGTYTKVGRTVFITALFTITSSGTAGGYAAVGGYPFAPNSTYDSMGVAREGASTGDVYCALLVRTNTAFILGLTGNGPISWVNGRTYYWDISYNV